MITVCKNVVSAEGTKAELIADLIAVFMALINEDHGHAVTAAIGFVLETGGKALYDQNN